MTKSIYEILIRANENAYKILLSFKENMKDSKLVKISDRLKNIDTQISYNRNRKKYIIHLYDEQNRKNRLAHSPAKGVEKNGAKDSRHTRKNSRKRRYEPKGTRQGKCWYNEKDLW